MELMKLANTGLGKNATPETMLKAYEESVVREKRSAWTTAVVVWKTVHHEKFKDYFSTQEKYAEEIGFTKSYVSKQVRAVDCYGELVKVDAAFENVSVGFVTELLLLNKEVTTDLLTDFIQTEGLEITDTRDAVRAKVKHYKNIINGGIDTSANIPSENKPDELTGDESQADIVQPENNSFIGIGGCVINDSIHGSIPIHNEDLINEIYDLLKKYGYEL